MPQTNLTPDEMVHSLNGYDEIAIGKHFDAEIMALKKRPLTFLRALVFIDQRRKGLTDPEAKDAALLLTLSEVHDYFAEDEAEPNPEEPVTEEGKGGSPPE